MFSNPFSIAVSGMVMVLTTQFKPRQCSTQPLFSVETREAIPRLGDNTWSLQSTIGTVELNLSKPTADYNSTLYNLSGRTLQSQVRPNLGQDIWTLAIFIHALNTVREPDRIGHVFDPLFGDKKIGIH